jgi:L-threonylcarbamoyladenylate synthase
MLPTDTVYGLAVSPVDEVAIHHLFEIKGRPLNINLPIMVADEQGIIELGLERNTVAQKLLDSSLIPGQITLVLGFDESRERPQWLNGRQEVAVRIPNHEQLLAILNLTGPLLVTSANNHGQPPSETVQEILQTLKIQPDLVLDGGSLTSTSSTLVNCRTMPPSIERIGAVSETEIWSVLND